jgi:hypothetical protein
MLQHQETSDLRTRRRQCAVGRSCGAKRTCRLDTAHVGSTRVLSVAYGKLITASICSCVIPVRYCPSLW